MNAQGRSGLGFDAFAADRNDVGDNLTDRTFAVFSTPAIDAADVYDETFHTHARAVLEPRREELMKTGRNASPVDDHSHYGVAFSVDDGVGGQVYVLLQVVDPWLLMLTRQLTWRDRLRRANEREVDAAVVAAVDAGLAATGVSSMRWFTQEECNRAASRPGRIDTTPPA